MPRCPWGSRAEWQSPAWTSPPARRGRRLPAAPRAWPRAPRRAARGGASDRRARRAEDRGRGARGPPLRAPRGAVPACAARCGPRGAPSRAGTIARCRSRWTRAAARPRRRPAASSRRAPRGDADSCQRAPDQLEMLGDHGREAGLLRGGRGPGGGVLVCPEGLEEHGGELDRRHGVASRRVLRVGRSAMEDDGRTRAHRSQKTTGPLARLPAPPATSPRRSPAACSTRLSLEDLIDAPLRRRQRSRGAAPEEPGGVELIDHRILNGPLILDRWQRPSDARGIEVIGPVRQGAELLALDARAGVSRVPSRRGPVSGCKRVTKSGARHERIAGERALSSR